MRRPLHSTKVDVYVVSKHDCGDLPDRQPELKRRMPIQQGNQPCECVGEDYCLVRRFFDNAKRWQKT